MPNVGERPNHVVYNIQCPTATSACPHIATCTQDQLLVLPDTELRKNPAGVIARVAAHAGLAADAPARRRAVCKSATACAGADTGSRPLPWAEISEEQLDEAIAETYEAFSRTGWVISGGYEPLKPVLRAELRALFAPFDAALAQLLGGCDILSMDAEARN